jgi:hypothetical protein
MPQQVGLDSKRRQSIGAVSVCVATRFGFALDDGMSQIHGISHSKPPKPV